MAKGQMRVPKEKKKPKADKDKVKPVAVHSSPFGEARNQKPPPAGKK